MGFTRTKMAAVLLLLCWANVFVQVAQAQYVTDTTYYPFQDLYEVQWSGENIKSLDNGQEVEIIMDQNSGAGFQSKEYYTYGFFGVGMQLVPGYSAGTVTAFFISSQGNNHDEVDYEFLGNVSGQPYVMQLNVFANGVGGREQRFYLDFDPTAAVHTYSILWNHAQILFLVDGNLVRVFKNLQSQGLAYPSTSQTQAFSALFDASSWATQGGAVGVNYAYSPFIATYSAFQLEACVNDGTNTQACSTNYANNWWEAPQYNTISASQLSYLQSFRQQYMIYDYCTDTGRYPTVPPECAANYS